MKRFDVFAKPVSLTYRGQFYYTTVTGGILSILLIGSFTIGFLLRFYELFFNPEYLFTARTYSYENTSAMVDSAIGNTLAYALDVPGLSVDETNSIFRVQFIVNNTKTNEQEYIDGMLCADIYKDFIETEEQKKS